MLLETVKKLWIATLIAGSMPAMSAENLDDIKGAWLGKMQIPNGPELTIGVEIFKKADQSWGGNVASLDQSARYIPVGAVTLVNNQLEIQLAAAPISIKGTVETGDTKISAQFNQGEAAFTLPLLKVAQLPEVKRQQTPAANSEYVSTEISLENKADKIWLAGTLSLPKTTASAPAVLLIAGSGPNHRDSYFHGHRTFKVIADYLAKRGFAVLRMDKRGVYKSGGVFHTAETKDFVSDAVAAVAFLKNHPRIQPDAIHVIGHSEGSLVASMMAQQVDLKSIISMAGPGMSVYDILVLQDQTEPAAKGAPDSAMPYLKAFSEKFYDSVLEAESQETRLVALQALYDRMTGLEKEIVNKWVEGTGTLNPKNAAQDSFKTFLQENPLDYWRSVKIPVLVLNGANDAQVPAMENVAGIYVAVGAETSASKKHIFPGLNHMFQTSTTGDLNDYAKIEETINIAVLDAIQKWVSKFE